MNLLVEKQGKEEEKTKKGSILLEEGGRNNQKDIILQWEPHCLDLLLSHRLIMIPWSDRAWDGRGGQRVAGVLILPMNLTILSR